MGTDAERTARSPLLAGAASLFLHALLAAGLFCCLPSGTPVGTADEDVLSLSLTSFPVPGAASPAAGPEEGPASPADASPLPAPAPAPAPESAQSRMASGPSSSPALAASPEKKEGRRDTAALSKKKEGGGAKERRKGGPAKAAGTGRPKPPATDTAQGPVSGKEVADAPEPAAGAASGMATARAEASGVVDVPFGRSCGPAFRRFVEPRYPAQARRAGISGLVRLRVSLDERGGVRGIEVLESSHSLLADAACAAIRRSSFRPYVSEGEARPSRTVIPVRFTLE